MVYCTTPNFTSICVHYHPYGEQNCTSDQFCNYTGAPMPIPFTNQHQLWHARTDQRFMFTRQISSARNLARGILYPTDGHVAWHSGRTSVEGR